MRIIRITPPTLDAALAEAARVLKAGGLVVYPTESFYAIGADALNPEAVARVFAAKGRGEEKPLPVIIHDKAEIARYVKELSPAARRAVERLMPGPVTVIFHASGVFPAALLAGTGKVAIRVPEHPAAAGLARALGGPVTATSANTSGNPGLTDPAEVARLFGGAADLLLDGGMTPGPPPSTLLDTTADPPAILREGRLSRKIIEAAIA